MSRPEQETYLGKTGSNIGAELGGIKGFRGLMFAYVQRAAPFSGTYSDDLQETFTVPTIC